MQSKVPQQVPGSEVGIVLVSGSCCIPGMAPFDEQARRIVEQAIAGTGVKAQLTILPVKQAFFGGIPRSVMDQMAEKVDQTGQIPLPAVLINDTLVALGVPTLDSITTALLQTVNQTTEKENPTHE